jgi:uncharacterized paraquat-inducible protein A
MPEVDESIMSVECNECGYLCYFYTDERGATARCPLCKTLLFDGDTDDIPGEY